jgi:poly(beta-D-mannuronate) lyase
MNRRQFLAIPVVTVPVWAAAEQVADPAQLKEAVRQAKPGDIILLRDGTWTDADLVIDAEGAPGKPITISAQTPGRVILTGHSRLRVGGRHIVVDGLNFKDGTHTDAVIAFRVSPTRLASECRITKCAIVDYLAKSKETDTKYLSMYGYKNRLDHCYLAGKLNLGTTLVVWLKEGDPVAEHLIEYNHFGPRPRLGLNGGETIRVGDSSTSMLSCKSRIEHNYFEKCSGEIEVISNKSCDNLYARNLFERCEGTLTLRHGNRCTVDGNFFLGHGAPNTGGIRIIGEDHKVVNNYLADLTGVSARAALSMMNGIPNSPANGYFQVKRAMVASNTVVNCVESIVIGIGDATKATLAPQASTFAKNVILGKQAPLVKMLNPQADVHWDGNTFYGADTGLKDVAASKDEPADISAPKIDRGGRGPDWRTI